MRRASLFTIPFCLSLNLHAADDEKSLAKKSILHEVTAVEFYGQEPRTPNALLLRALYTESGEKFTHALCIGANPNICYGPHKNPILSIVVQNITRATPFFAEWLLNFKADINARNAEGQTPLMAACSKGCGEVIQYLLTHNAGIALVDNGGNNALAYAVHFRNLGSLKFLIQHKCDLNSGIERRQVTPLMIAGHGGYADVVSVLLSFGADPFVKDITDKMALDYTQGSSKRDHTDAVKELRFKQTVKVLEAYTDYSRAIYGATPGPLERIVASYLVCRDPDIKKSH